MNYGLIIILVGLFELAVTPRILRGGYGPGIRLPVPDMS